MNIHWKDWCWSWNSNTLATWYKELTHLKRLWSWERLKLEGEGDDRGQDGWMASPAQWTWVWVNCRSWWRTGKSGVLQSMGSERVGHNWATELNWRYLWDFYPKTSHDRHRLKTNISLLVSEYSLMAFVFINPWQFLFPRILFGLTQRWVYWIAVFKTPSKLFSYFQSSTFFCLFVCSFGFLRDFLIFLKYKITTKDKSG